MLEENKHLFSMSRRIARSFFLGIFLFAFFLPLFAPLPADAGLVVCGLNQDDSATAMNEAATCTMCHVIYMAANLVKWMMQMMTVIAIAIIFAMGVWYIVSVGNPSTISKAKSGIWAALIGFALILSAWLIVNLVLSLLANSGMLSSFQQTGAFTFSCNADSTAGTAKPGTGTTGVINTGGGDTGGTGSCQVAGSGACSPAALAGTCFAGANVNTWSAICQKESGGIVSRPSGVDKCTIDGSVVSFGLFQINISANKIGGLNCPAAFTGGPYTGSNKSCKVTNRPLYDQCVAAAKNATKNIETACRLAAPSATNTGPWGAARACNIPKKL